LFKKEVFDAWPEARDWYANPDGEYKERFKWMTIADYKHRSQRKQEGGSSNFKSKKRFVSPDPSSESEDTQRAKKKGRSSKGKGKARAPLSDGSGDDDKERRKGGKGKARAKTLSSDAMDGSD
jgi:hypothetical protein